MTLVLYKGLYILRGCDKMDFVELKQQFNHLNEQFNEIKGYINLEADEKEMARLDEVMQGPHFWSNQREAKVIIDQINQIKKRLETLDEITKEIEEVEVGLDLYEDSEDDSFLKEVQQLLKGLKQKISQFELELLLIEPYDQNNAILEIHPGAGGTESQDWGEMLLRMYMRYAELKKYKVEILDYLEGEEAGIKSVTLLFKGLNAYGYLKAEKGVHRLVRISPFDSSGRRHTSFASIDVTPEINEEIEIEIKSDELKIDTYRSSGAGGQHVNTTDSAIRITHLPTGVVVSCQSGRSQIQNREQAMKVLKMKLYQQKLEDQKKEMESLRGEQKDIGWGSQIRSYVFHPYSMIKDHRTNAEVTNVQPVMDGNIEYFIKEYLKSQIKTNTK